ncbi:MAG: DUF4404 family protein [Myxococcales bacterium]|nr:DUF4404 family protein [Myxococcales bacterium]MCB9732737.1 DUF4404 family protein [Deltaproteobacteria bacterium]
MKTQQLKDALDEVQREAAAGGELDERTRELLESLRDGITRLLTTPAAERAPEDTEGLVELVKGGIDQFEGEHPRLTTVMGRLADALTAMGI